jgi:hypothetical protein
LGMAAGWFWLNRLRNRPASTPFATMAEILSLGLAAWAMYSARTWSQAASEVSWIGPAGAAWLLNAGFCSLPFALVVLSFANERGLIARLLRLRGFVLLGEISYSFYLLHLIFIYFFNAHARAFANFPPALVFLLLFTLVLLASLLVWALVERPCRALVLRWFDARSANGAVSTDPLCDSPQTFSRSSSIVRPRCGALALFAVLLAVTVYLARFRSAVRTIPESRLAEIVQLTPSEWRAVHFDNRFVLAGFTWTNSPSRSRLHLVWHTLSDQRLDFLNAIHLVDSAGKILSQADYLQDPAQATLRGKTVWEDIVEFEQAKLDQAQHLAIGLLKDKQWLFADRGPRDWGFRRLLIPLPGKANNLESPRILAEEFITPPGLTNFRGYLEVVNSNQISGWVWSPDKPEQKLAVDIFDGDVRLATLVATNSRPDLQKAKIGDGGYGFRAPAPVQLKDGKGHRVHVRVAGTAFELRNSPKIIEPLPE